MPAWLSAASAALLALTLATPPSARAATGPEAVTPNDNTRPTGTASGRTVTIRLRAAEGRGRLWLDVRTTSGKWQAQGEVIVR